MAQHAVAQSHVSIHLACLAFVVSESCDRYHPQLSEANKDIADWLIKLTNEESEWGFGLCFDYQRNVKGFTWNHKRVYRIYYELTRP